MKETYMQFKKHIAKEGYSIRFSSSYCGQRLYTMITPDHRMNTDTLDNLKDWIGE